MNSDKFKIPERCESRSYSRARPNSSRGGNFTSSDKNHWQPRCNSVAFNRPANTSSSRQFSGNSSHWNPRSRNSSISSEISFFGEMPTNGRYNENFSTHFNTRHRSMSKNESSHGDWRNQTLPTSMANNDDSFGGSNKHFSRNESSRQFNGNQWQNNVGMSNGINGESKENFNQHNHTFSSSSFPQQKVLENGNSNQSQSNSSSRPRSVAEFFNSFKSRPVTNDNTTNCKTPTANGQQMKASVVLVEDSKSTHAAVPNVDSLKIPVNDSNTQDTPVTSKLNKAKAMLRAENKLRTIDLESSILPTENSERTTSAINSTAEPVIAFSADNLAGLDSTIDTTFDSHFDTTCETDKESVCSNRKTREAGMSAAPDGEEMSEGLIGKKDVRQLCRFVTNTVSLSTNTESVQEKLDDQSKEKSKDDTNNCGITSSMETTRQSRDHIGTSCLSHHQNPRLRSQFLGKDIIAEEGLIGKKDVRQLCHNATNTPSLETNFESVPEKLDDERATCESPPIYKDYPSGYWDPKQTPKGAQWSEKRRELKWDILAAPTGQESLSAKMGQTQDAPMSISAVGNKISAKEGLLGNKDLGQLCHYETNTNTECVQKKLDDHSRDKSNDHTINSVNKSSNDTDRHSVRGHFETSFSPRRQAPRFRSQSLDSFLRAKQTMTSEQKLSAVSLYNLKFPLEPKNPKSKRFRFSIPQEIQELLKNRLHKQKYTRNSEIIGFEIFSKILDQDEQIFYHYLVHMEYLRNSNKCSYFAEFGSFADFVGRMNTFHLFHSNEILNNPKLCYTKQQEAVDYLQTRIDHYDADGDKDQRMIAHFQRCQMAVKFSNRTALLEALAMKDMDAPSGIMESYEFLNMLFIYTGNYIFS